jgi:hypothetical protein
MMTRRAVGSTSVAGLAALALALALALAAAGCGSATQARSPGQFGTVPAVPLNTSVSTAAGTWATVVMGGSAAQHNNFWQLFNRPSDSATWTLVTPPGTADNGGLVLAQGIGQALITAFRPSQDLTFTPLTQTSDLGRTWSALSPLDAALASTPDSLAVQPSTGRLLALLDTGTAEQGTSNGDSWTSLITTRALAVTQAGKSCGLRALTAATYTPAGTLLLAGMCARPGAVGIFASTGHAWRAAGPALPPALARQPIAVLRLTTAGSQTAALLSVGRGQRTALVAAWSAEGGTSWTLSPPLSVESDAITAVSFGPDQSAAVLTGRSQGAVLTGGHWQPLPALPADTAALALGTNGATDALSAHGATLTIWQLAGTTSSWTKEQTISVPIEYGSSS